MPLVPLTSNDHLRPLQPLDTRLQSRQDSHLHLLESAKHVRAMFQQIRYQEVHVLGVGNATVQEEHKVAAAAQPLITEFLRAHILISMKNKLQHKQMLINQRMHPRPSTSPLYNSKLKARPLW